MAFPVSSPAVSMADMVSTVASVNAALFDGSEAQVPVYGWGVSQIIELKSILENDGWNPVGVSPLSNVSDIEIYFVKGKAKIYAMASSVFDSFVSVEIAEK